MITKKMIRLNLGDLSREEYIRFMDCYNKLFPRVTVSGVGGITKPLSMSELIEYAKIIEPEPLSSELVKKLIKTYAPIIFDAYDVTFDGSILKLDGIAIKDIDITVNDANENWVKYLKLISESYLTESNRDFVLRIIGSWKYDPLTFKLKVKPKNFFSNFWNNMINN